MRLLLLLFTVLVVISEAAASDEERSLTYMLVPFERGSNTAPAVSVFLNLGMNGFGRKNPRPVIACIWPDGRAVWSRDRIKGGPPYFSGRVDPKRLAAFIDNLDVKGVFTRKLWLDVDVDAPCHDLHISNGPKRVFIETSGDYYTRGRKLPERVADVSDATLLFRTGVEELLPRQGQRLPDVEFRFRPL